MPSCAAWAGRGQPWEDRRDEEGSRDQLLQPRAGREIAVISMLPLTCCPEPACEPKPASKTSPQSSVGFDQAWEAAGTPACLQCGRAGYGQLPGPRLIWHRQAAG